MSVFRQERNRFENFDQVSAEIANIYKQLNTKIVHMATRAPVANDDGFVWIHKNGSQLDFYVKDWQSGTWRSEAFT